jgi:flagellar biosynthetic protein FliP
MKRWIEKLTKLPKSLHAMLAVIGLAGLILVFGGHHAFAQAVNFDLGAGPTTTSKLIQIVLLITVLSLAPSILVMVTCFTRVIVVLSFLRTALGTQQTPPNIVLMSLALFLTLFIMQPTFEQAWEAGVRPLMNNQIDEETAFTRGIEPFHDFMIRHTRQKDIDLFVAMSKNAAGADDTEKPAATPNAAANKPAANSAPAAGKDKNGITAEQDDVSLRALIPAFMISELRRAFEIGFLLFLPFLIIDMVVASILMSMGMMMLPPSIISLPFKIIFFVLVDGWYLICGSLVQSYGGG